jgi:nucleoid-associated protein YgaU
MSPRIAEKTKERRDAVVIPRIDTRLIVRGDNLWRISEAKYGLGQRYTVIFGANRDKIRNPDLIYPGQIFVLPKARSGR